MENGTRVAGDVWRRVKPTLNPWPGADAVGKALSDGAAPDGVVSASDLDANHQARRQGLKPLKSLEPAPRVTDAAQSPQAVTRVTDAAQSLEPVTWALADADSLPGAEPDPCCMGTEAETDLDVLTGFIEDERSERRQLQALARQAPVWARQSVLTLAAHAAARARRLSAAHYLIVGESYLPAICAEKIYVGKWRPALRERYHGAACAAMNYERAADGSPDPCLQDLFRTLSADAFDCAGVIMRLLERSLT